MTEQNENRINVAVPENYNGMPIEVILREGQAPEALNPKEPIPVNITGTIDSPLRWLEKRVELIDQKQANIIVDRDCMKISLVDKENDYYNNGIAGMLKPSKEMIEFGIKYRKKMGACQTKPSF